VIQDVYKPYGAFEERFIHVNETRVSGILMGVSLRGVSEGDVVHRCVAVQRGAGNHVRSVGVSWGC